ncbi:hypothetical protein GCM10023205_46020 [Yinghuangia aomiensis]|uniref:Secreted protein n=1 Tax=Yinghuangia aomiensis TaxID=676205 RepID=A0ABP9HMX8_9ACTN
MALPRIRLCLAAAAGAVHIVGTFTPPREIVRPAPAATGSTSPHRYRRARRTAPEQHRGFNPDHTRPATWLGPAT